MKFSHITLVLLLMAAMPRLSAETQRFRSGEILGAELSEELPSMRNRASVDFSNLPEKRIYAALTVSLDPGRKISIYDYSLQAFGVRYRCLALRSGSSYIDGEEYVSGGGDGSRCTLYFALNAREVGLGQRERLQLVCNVPPESRQTVTFTNRGSRSFTPPRNIPNSGIMAVEK